MAVYLPNMSSVHVKYDLMSLKVRLDIAIDSTVGLENFTTEKVHEYVFSTIVDSFHELNIHDWVV